MANNRQIKIGVGFDVDKSGLQSTLKDIESIKTKLGSISASASLGDKMNKELQDAGKTASQLSDILSKSFNTNLGTINVTKFKNELAKTGMTISDVRQKLSGAGADGKAAFAQVGSALLSTNVQLKESNKLLDKMAQSMSNTVTWGITSSIFNNITNSVQDAYHYVKQLDSSLNDIRIVTDKSAESMAKFAVQANDAAKNLGASTRDYTDASLIYYQQGLGEADVAARAETTLKAANVTGQNTEEVSQQLTAVWNGYKVSAEEAELYVDKLAAVAATTASDLEELSTGMSKVASAANLMGVDVDSLNAQLATIVSVTRQAPESVGTALKTIYARMGDIEAGVDTETTLGNYTAEMKAMGFNVLDANGKLRDMSDVIEEIGNKWTTLSREQQIALSQTMAGTRQYNNLLSLFDNWDMYTEAMETSANAAGTLQEQQDTYMESTAAHLQQLSTSAEDIFDTLIKPEEINAVIDVFRNGTDVLGAFFDAFGGGVKSMVAGAAVISGIFSKQIGQGLINLQASKSQAQNNKDLADVKKGAILKNWEDKGESASGSDAAKAANYEKQSQLAKDILEVESGITEQQYQQMTTLQTELGALAEKKELIKQNLIADNEKLGISEKDTQELLDDDDVLDEQAQYTENIRIDLGKEQEALAELNKEQEHNYQIQKKIQELDRLSVEDFDREADALSKTKEGEEILNLYLEEKNAQQVIQDRIEDTNKAIDTQKSKVQEVNDELKKQEQIHENIINAKEQTEQVENQETEKQASFDQQKEDAEKAAFLQNSVDLLTNSLSVLATTWGAFQSLGSIWSDEDLSFGEKLAQTFGLLITSGGLLINSVGQIKDAYSGLTNIFKDASDAQAVQVKILEMLGVAQTKEAATTMTQAGANEIENATEDETQKENIESTVTETAQAGAETTEAAATMNQVKANLTKIGSGAKEAGKTLLSKVPGVLDEIFKKLGKFIGPLAAITLSLQAIKIWANNFQKWREEDAKAAATQAKAQDEVVQKTNEEYNKTKELNNAYDKLKEQYKNNEISTGELRLQIVDLLQQYGLEKEAVEAKTASYEELLEIMNKINGVSMDDVITENEKGIEAQKNAIKTDIWANQVEGSSRDSFFGLGEKTVDVGIISGFDDLSDILKDYEINFDLAGHVNLDDLTRVLVEDGNAFISELSNSTSESADKLLEIVSTQQESIDAASGYQNTIDETKVEKIQEDVYGDNEKKGGFKNIEEYNNAVTKMADSLQSEGIVETYSEALEKARELLSTQDDLAASMHGWESVAGTAGATFADSVANNFTDSKDLIDKVLNETGMSIEEFSKLDIYQQRDILKANLSEDEYQKVALGFEQFKNAADDANLSLKNFYDQAGKKNPLEGLWLEDETFKAKTQDLFQYALDSGKQDLLNYFTEEDWDKILALDTAEDRMEKFQELMAYHLSDLKEDFGSTLAPGYNEAATSLISQDAYISPDNIEDFSEYDSLINNAELIKTIIPELTDEMDTLADKSKAGTEEWNEALLDVQQTMAAMAEDPDGGIFTKENAKESGLTTEGLTEAYNTGAIDEDTYNKKMTGANLADIEAAGIDEEAYSAYVDTLQDISENLEENEDMARRIATANLKQSKTIETLASDYEEYGDILKKGDKSNIKYAEGMNKIRGSVEDLFGKQISDDFITEHLEDIEKLAKGDLTVFDELAKAATEDIIVDIAGVTDADQLSGEFANLNSMIQNTDLENLEIGASLDSTGLDVALQGMLDSAAITVDECNAILEGMGFEPKIDYQEVPVEVGSVNQTTQTAEVIGPDGEKRTVSLDSITKTDGGSVAKIPIINGSSTSFRGAPKSTTPMKPKSGGGGGGGGSKGKKAEKQEKFKADIDPFHEVNEQIDLLNTNLDRLAKKQEKAFGKDLINNLKEQGVLLEKQNKNLQDKIKITEKEIAQNKYKMQNLKVAGKKAEISFNKDGSIANYDEALSSAEARVNKLVSKYNKIAKKEYKEGSKKDKNRKKLAKNIEKAKEDYSELQELMDGYDEYLVSKEDLINQVQDNIDKIVENNVTIFTTAIEIKLEVRDAKVSYNNFLNEWNSLTAKQPVKLKVDTDLNNANIAKDNIEDLTTMVTKTQAELATIQQGGVSTLFGKNEKLAYDTLKGYTEKLQSSLSDLQGYYQDVAASIVDAMDEVSEAMDEQISDMEFYADSLQHVINVNQKLLGESASAANNKEHYKNLVKQNNETIGVLKKNADYWKEEMNKMAGVNEEAYKTAKENYISATKEMQSALETSLENIQTALENSITSIFETFTNSLLSENWGFDNMIQDWEMAVSESETYLTNINKANQLKQLELKYQQAIDKSSSLSTQKELLALKQEELNMLKEQGRLTQYDIDRANKKLQLKLAEIALEEAQNNKSKLRLRRDSQGNYSYQYTADEDNVAEKQAEVDNLKAEMAEDDWKYFKTNVTNAIDSFSTFKSDYAEMLASGASQEELQEFLEGYAQEMTNNTDLFNDSINYLLNSTATATGQDLNKMTEEEKIAMLQEQFGEDIMTSESLSFLKKLSNNTKTAEDATNYLKDNILSLAQTEIKWAEEQKEAAGEYAGYSKDFSTMNTALEDINTEVNKFNENSKTTITNLKEQLDGVQEVFNIIKTFLTDEKVKAGLEALKKAIGTNKDANGNDVTSDGSLSAAGSDAQAGSVGSTAGTTTMTAENTDAEKIVTEQQKTNQGNTTIEKGDVVKITKKSVQAYKKVKGKNKFKKNGKANKGEYIVQAAPVTVGKNIYAELAKDKWVKKESISGYDTGGYTGDWKSSEGRLAFLHQKELVLNAKDTENMLKMLDISRSMTSVMSSVSNKIKDMMYQIDKANYTRNMNSRTQLQDASNQLEQNIHIEATFPNVSQSHEIEDAFNNLINIAAQRAYRNRR